jgi:transcriptional regulator with XRE-family HTH domain
MNKTQAQMAAIAQVSQATWQRAELGTTDKVPIEVLVRVAAAAGLSLDYLVFGREPAVPPPIDEELLRLAYQIAERVTAGRQMTSDTRARALFLLYMHLHEMRAAGAKTDAEQAEVIFLRICGGTAA